jgi:stage II sporulation protein D
MLYAIIITFGIPYSINFYYDLKYTINSSKKNHKYHKSNNKLGLENKKKIIMNNENNNILEEYIKSVVAAEMPASFASEALKAQAVAARTYALRNCNDINNLNKLYQEHISIDEMKKRWGKNFDTYYQKISDAVDETRGEVVKYGNEIIEAVFHSTSAGVTENSENVWKNNLPYLRSVDSHEDEKAPNFISKKTFDIQDLIDKINNEYKTELTVENFLDKFVIKNKTDAGYVTKIQVDNKIVNGMEFRMLLGLRSTNFDLKKNGNEIIFTTKGFGHGAGMSQYGANFMAQEGYNYKEILMHYYSGVTISHT